MSNEIVKFETMGFLAEVDQMREACTKLSQAKHYAKMGQEGIFAVMMMARTLNLNPFDALNGGLYSVNGKVEMSARMMNELIRRAGHSITKDPKSDHTICILHGRRSDNGDTWTESFSIMEAKSAGIYRSGTPWEKYPKDMLFARALSRLARQLFPDIIKGCYVEGEIQQAEDAKWTPSPVAALPVDETIDTAQEMTLLTCLENDQDGINQILKIANIKSLKDLPVARYEKCLAWAKKRQQERIDEDKNINEIPVMSMSEILSPVTTEEEENDECVG